MKIKSNQPELDNILNEIWEEFSPTESTTLPEALRLCYLRVKQLEAELEQRDIVDGVFYRLSEEGPGDQDNGHEGCGNPNCLVCKINQQIKKSAGNN